MNEKRIRIIKLLLILSIITIIILTITKINKLIIEKESINLNYNQTYNKIWTGAFQIAWNEFMDSIGCERVEFEYGNSEFVNELNNREFTKDMLLEESYYVKVGQTSKKLRQQILNDIENKFKMETISLLENMKTQKHRNQYTIYAIMRKEFEYLTSFDKLEPAIFGKSEPSLVKYDPNGLNTVVSTAKWVNYFGINNDSPESMNINVEVLFFNSANDFATKIKTKEGEEIILYRTNNVGDFKSIYKELENKTKIYTGNKQFSKYDEIKIPYINLEETINYSELCGKKVKGTKNVKITNAMQNIEFMLNETGSKLTNEAQIQYSRLYYKEEARYFYYIDTFVLFMKEKEKEQPYMAIIIDNADFLEEV